MRSSIQKRSAFTLLELVVVLALMGMLTGAAVFSLRAPLQNARMKRLLASIEDADRRARDEARRSSEYVELSVDSERGTATQSVLGGQSHPEDRRALPFSGGLSIDGFKTERGSTDDRQFTVRYGPDGQSITYAVRLGTDRKPPQSRRTWLVVIGATGQYIRTNEDSVVEAIVSKYR